MKHEGRLEEQNQAVKSIPAMALFTNTQYTAWIISIIRSEEFKRTWKSSDHEDVYWSISRIKIVVILLAINNRFKIQVVGEGPSNNMIESTRSPPICTGHQQYPQWNIQLDALAPEKWKEASNWAKQNFVESLY